MILHVRIGNVKPVFPFRRTMRERTCGFLYRIDASSPRNEPSRLRVPGSPARNVIITQSVARLTRGPVLQMDKWICIFSRERARARVHSLAPRDDGVAF